MCNSISNKINRIFNRLKNAEYTGDIRCKHFAVAIRGGKMISPVMCNQYRTIVFGKVKGTIHSEMNSLSYILNRDKSVERYNNHSISYIEEQCVLRSKRLQETT